MYYYVLLMFYKLAFREVCCRIKMAPPPPNSKKDSLEFWNFFQKSKDEGTVRLKVNAQTVVLARKLINLSTCF